MVPRYYKKKSYYVLFRQQIVISRHQSLVMFFRSCPPSFLRQGLTGLELANEASLGSQQAMGIHLSLAP